MKDKNKKQRRNIIVNLKRKRTRLPLSSSLKSLQVFKIPMEAHGRMLKGMIRGTEFLLMMSGQHTIMPF